MHRAKSNLANLHIDALFQKRPLTKSSVQHSACDSSPVHPGRIVIVAMTVPLATDVKSAVCKCLSHFRVGSCNVGHVAPVGEPV